MENPSLEHSEHTKYIHKECGQRCSKSTLAAARDVMRLLLTCNKLIKSEAMNSFHLGAHIIVNTCL